MADRRACRIHPTNTHRYFIVAIVESNPIYPDKILWKIKAIDMIYDTDVVFAKLIRGVIQLTFRNGRNLISV